MAKLTVKTVDSLVRARTKGLTNDGNGLYLQISRYGTASWVFRYKIAGKARMMGLGAYPLTSLADARQKAMQARLQTQAGMDPLQARDQERERQQKVSQREHQRRQRTQEAKQAARARAIPFKQVAEDYIEAHRAGWKNTKHAQQWENTLATYAEPVIGKLPTADITTEHVLSVLQPIWTLKPETASRLRNRIELVLDAAKARGLRDGDNPARWRGHLDKLLPKRSKVRAIEHHAALPWKELPQFMLTLSAHDELSYQAMRLTILTACRTSEILGSTWPEIDLKTGTWTIPAQRMKAGKEHRVPLSDAALALLEGLPRLHGNAHVFPGARKERPLSNAAMMMALRRLGRGDLTMHGFRSTFRDWAAERTLYPREVCEMALAHRIADGAEAAYWRGDMFEKRRSLMAEWAHYAMSQVQDQGIRS